VIITAGDNVIVVVMFVIIIFDNFNDNLDDISGDG
jgi:hypothetical protein